MTDGTGVRLHTDTHRRTISGSKAAPYRAPHASTLPSAPWLARSLADATLAITALCHRTALAACASSALTAHTCGNVWRAVRYSCAVPRYTCGV